MKRVKLLSSILVLVMVLALVACNNSTPSSSSTEVSPADSTSPSTEPAEAKADILIGIVAPVTGPNAAAGADIKNGAQMAVDEINAAGGVDGHMLTLTVEDDSSVPATSVAAVEKLVGEKTVGIIGSFNSSCTIANMEVTKREGVPQITVSAADSITTTAGSTYMFRNSPYTSMFAEAMMNYVKDSLPNIKTLAILGENTDYGQGIIKSIAGFAEGAGITVVATETYTPKDTDFYSQLTKVKENNPDGIVLAGDRTEGAQLVLQGQELGLGDKQWFGFLSMSTTNFHELADGAEDGLIFVSCFEPVKANEKATKFVERVEEKNGQSPTMHFAISYDAVYLFAEAMKDSYSDDLTAFREAVRANLDAMEGYPSIFGSMSFDDNGQAVTPAFVGQWKDGKKEVLAP